MNNANGSQGSEQIFVGLQASETAGAISYWRLSGNVSLAALADAWKAEGLDVKLLPSQPGDEVAAGRAVRDLQVKRRLVRPLAKRGAWVILDESVSAGGDNVHHVRVATVKFEGGHLSIDQGEAPFETFLAARQQIRDGYDRARAELAPEDISGWLIKLAHDRAAVSLRESGGIYFVPRTGVDFWNKAVAAITAVSAHKIFRIPALKNSEAIDAILDAVTVETSAAAAQIEAELLAEGDEALGLRALKTRGEACGALLAKVEAYEALLGTKLPTLVSRIEDLRANVAAVALKTEQSADEAQAAA